jgi:MFS family permease
MATMDLFIVNVSLHSIGVGFGGELLSNVAWVLSAYAIVFGALLVPAGRFADRYGRKSSFPSLKCLERRWRTRAVGLMMHIRPPILPKGVGGRIGVSKPTAGAGA